MVKLEARATEKDIIISIDSFEHLLDCLDNQKYVGEVNADALEMSVKDIHSVQNDIQARIDDFNRQCRKVWLSSGNKEENTAGLDEPIWDSRNQDWE